MGISACPAMEAKDLASFSEYLDSGDSDGYVEDLNDDENFSASGGIPKLQSRKDVSKARWIHDLKMAEVVVMKGQTWRTTGIVRNGKIYCSIEETLFLAEIGTLQILNDDDTSLPLGDIYNLILEQKNGCSWEIFEAYKHLKSLGYVIGRHGIPWSMKGVTSNSLAEGLSDINEMVDFELREIFVIPEMFSGIQINEDRPTFDVYPPNSKFKKSSPGNPSFVLCLARGLPPSKQEVKELEKHCGGCPLKFCNVDHGRFSYVSFNRVELPILP